MFQKCVYTDTVEQTENVMGHLDSHASLLEGAFSVLISVRESDRSGGNAITVSGDEANVLSACMALDYLCRLAKLSGDLTEQNVRYAVSMVRDGKTAELAQFDWDCVCTTKTGKPVKAKTVGQKQYVDKIRQNTIVLGVGPAGTGKTFLAVAMAVAALRAKEVSRIILTRPAVEAGERLGYLPGDLQSKIDPYLRPLYDALYEMMGSEAYTRSVERGIIEIAPLAYMRGRTLDDSFIILDEAQNTTQEQMKMFLTRLGFRSKAVVTGDLSQTDLPSGKKSGLADAVRLLSGISGIAVHTFTGRDVVRHHLVQKIIEAYDRAEKGGEASAPACDPNGTTK